MFCSIVGGRGGSGDKVAVSTRIVDGPVVRVVVVEVEPPSTAMAVLATVGEEGRESAS